MSERLKKYLNSKGFFAVNDKLEADMSKVILEETGALDLMKRFKHIWTTKGLYLSQRGDMSVAMLNEINDLISKYENTKP